jgi:hypothetical protein
VVSSYKTKILIRLYAKALSFGEGWVGLTKINHFLQRIHVISMKVP